MDCLIIKFNFNKRYPVMRFNTIILGGLFLLGSSLAHAQVLPQADIGIKIPLAKEPSTRPMGVAYVPYVSRYYIADGGLAPMPGDMESPFSKSQIHVYDENGNYLNSTMPGFD